MKKKLIGKLFIVFGLITLIANFVDYLSVLLPIHLRSNQWVYNTVQKFSDMSIIPLLAIIFIISGFYLFDEKGSRISLIFEKSIAGLCSLFAVFLITITLLFTISLSSVENDIISKIKTDGQKAKEQLMYIAEKSPNVTDEQVQQNIKKIDQTLVYKVKQVKHSFIIKNIKILVNLLAYLFAYLYFAVNLFNISAQRRKTLIYEKN